MQIDAFDTDFLPVEQHALVCLKAKVEQYRVQNRFWEAQAMERACGIVYSCLKADYQETQPTNMGDLL